MFETHYKSNEDNILDATTELTTLIQTQAPLQCHNTSPRKTAIEKLKDLLLQSPSSLPKVDMDSKAPVLRVNIKEPICNQSNTDDPLDLIEENISITDQSSESPESTLQKY